MIQYEGNKFFGAKYHKRISRPPLPDRSPLLWLGSNAAWIVLGAIAFGILTAALSFGVGIGHVVGFLSPALALIVLSAIAAFMTSLRLEQARRVMLYVHQAVRLNLPIPDLLHAAQAGERGRMRARLVKLRRLLLEGLALGYAIELAAPGVPRRHVAAVAAGEHLGRLPEALDRIVSDGSTVGGDGNVSLRSAASSAARLQLRWYPVVMLVFLGTAINVFLIFVMPKFESIFDDFKLRMPPLTTALIDFWRGWGGVIFSVVPVLVLVVYCGRTIAVTVAPRWAGARSGLQLTDYLAWWTPVLRSVVRNRGLADACFVAADALGAAATLPRALAEAATVPGNVVVRQRVAKWAGLVEQGDSASDAARNAGMPELVCGMISSGVGSRQLAEAFKFLARYYDARASRLAAAIEGAAVPALSLLFGGAVAALALAVFLPLLGLIDLLNKQGFQ